MKTYSYKGCDISIYNESKIISDLKAFRFCEKYLMNYLAAEGVYIPEQIELKESITVILTNDEYYIYV